MAPLPSKIPAESTFYTLLFRIVTDSFEVLLFSAQIPIAACAIHGDVADVDRRAFSARTLAATNSPNMLVAFGRTRRRAQ